jgi:hypothetical protein
VPDLGRVLAERFPEPPARQPQNRIVPKVIEIAGAFCEQIQQIFSANHTDGTNWEKGPAAEILLVRSWPGQNLFGAYKAIAR